MCDCAIVYLCKCATVWVSAELYHKPYHLTFCGLQTVPLAMYRLSGLIKPEGLFVSHDMLLLTVGRVRTCSRDVFILHTVRMRFLCSSNVQMIFQ